MPCFFNMDAETNTRVLQNVRRSDGAGAKHDFAGGRSPTQARHCERFPHRCNAAHRCCRASILSFFTRELVHVVRIRPVFDRAQERLRSIPAPAVFLRDVKVADAEMSHLLKSSMIGMPARLRRFVRTHQEFPLQTLLFDSPLAAASMHLWQSPRHCRSAVRGCSDRACRVFIAHEVLQLSCPRPFRITSQPPPNGRSREPGHACRSSR